MEEEMKGEERSADEAGKDGNDVVLDMDNLLWVKYMEAELDTKSKHCQPSHPFTISRVPRYIRMVDTHAYEPLFVSIGPYHRGNQSLVDMEEVKWRNLKDFRGRAGESFNMYLKAMKEIEPRARACYSGNIDMIKADEFIEMMLLDGLFIIELLSTRGKSFLALLGFFNIDIEEPICTGMLSRVGQDMFLLENQLPFFVLECLWNLTGQGSGFDLWKRACIFILDFALPFEHKWDLNLLRVIFVEEEKKKKENSEMINEDGVHHLLHLVYLLLKPTSLTRKSESMEATGNSELSMEPTGSSELSMEPTAKLPAFIGQKKSTLSFQPPRCRICFPFPSCQESQAMQPISSRLLPEFKMKMKTISFQPPRCRICFPCQSSPSPSGQESQSMKCTAKLSAVIKKILTFLSPSKSKGEQPPPLAVIPSAAELDEAGVEFRCVQAQSFLDIKFERGTMKMPRLSVQDSTISLLRNFIAFEQSFPNRGSHITSYCSFMDDLVNTPRDVEILKKSAIIENCLGCDKEVADLFNDLCKGIFLPDESSNYLAKPSEDVRKHTKKVWHKWRAKLLHDYFGSPWSIISFLGVTFVIILTIVQTYYAVFT